MKRQNGITLVALIITIIVMIILAGVAIVVAVGDGGVINKAQTATDSQKYQTVKEQVEAQCVYITKGKNVGKIDLDQTLKNITDLKLQEIDYTEGKTRIEGDSLIVTLKNGEIITIGGEYNGNIKYYEVPGNPYNVDVFAINYNNNTVTGYIKNTSGNYEAIFEVPLTQIPSSLDINVGGNIVTLDTNAKTVYGDSSNFVLILESKCYLLNEADGTYAEILPSPNFTSNLEFTQLDGNLYDLLINGDISVGATITGYASGDWIIYKLYEENVIIVPQGSSWNITYTYDTTKTNEQNLKEVQKICNNYLNSNYATKVEIPTSAEAYAVYLGPNNNRNTFEAVYAYNSNKELIGAYASGKGYGDNEYPITSAVEYKILPIVTLDKDVRATGGKYNLRLYK